MNPPEKWAAEKIIKLMESGSLPPWRKTWVSPDAGLPKNIRGNNYRGMNRWLLLMAPYASPLYLTLKQVLDLGGRVKEEEFKQSWPVYFWAFDKNKDPDKKRPPFCKGYRVWNSEQTDLPPEKLPQLICTEFPNNPIEVCDSIVTNYNGPIIKHMGKQPCYAPKSDVIRIPKIIHFKTSEKYYGTLFHELGHSTGAEHRLNRKTLVEHSNFGDHSYSEEELVAEFTASMLCSHAGIAREDDIENSASYISHWATKLKAQPHILLDSIRNAEKAYKLIIGEEKENSEEEE